MKKALPFTAIILFLSAPAWASAAPYVKPESLWPFRSIEGLMMLLGLFAAYRAIRSHLPAGNNLVMKRKSSKKNDERKLSTQEVEAGRIQPGAKKVSEQVLDALRVAGLIFMVAGSFLIFHSGSIDYGPAHFDELTTRIFGGALFLVGLSDFLILPKLLGGPKRK